MTVAQVGGMTCEVLTPLPRREVGRFGSRLARTARRIGSSRAFRAIARTALSLARTTPQGQAAAGLIGMARTAARAARAAQTEAHAAVGPAAAQRLLDATLERPTMTTAPVPVSPLQTMAARRVDLPRRFRQELILTLLGAPPRATRR